MLWRSGSLAVNPCLEQCCLRQSGELDKCTCIVSRKELVHSFCVLPPTAWSQPVRCCARVTGEAA